LGQGSGRWRHRTRRCAGSDWSWSGGRHPRSYPQSDPWPPLWGRRDNTRQCNM